MTTQSQLAALLRPVRHLMLDFDGPVCHMFAGRPAPGVADRLRALIAAEQEVPAELADEADPLGFYRYTPKLSPQLAARVTERLRAEEVEAATTAELTPGVVDVMRACRQTGRAVTVVSNNTPEAVQTFLTKHDLSKYIDHVSGRSNADPALMKPSPYLLQRAADAVETRLAACALVGDSDTDIQAAHATSMTAIGYANKPGKAERFAELRAEAIISDMHVLAAAVLDARPPRMTEPEDENMVRALAESLSILAADSDAQVAWLDQRGFPSDELAEDHSVPARNAQLMREEGLISADVCELAERIDAIFTEMSGAHNSARWTDEALATDPGWVQIRALARRAVALLGPLDQR